MKHFFLLALALVLTKPAAAQQLRLQDYNTIGWLVYNGDHALGTRWTLHTEVQVRRVQLVGTEQQTLYRAGLGYQLLPRLRAGGGYAYTTTGTYGAHPLAAGGQFPEHRFYGDLVLTDRVGYVDLTQRLRYEQRYLGLAGASGPLNNEAVWNRQNRLRWLLRLALPLQGHTLDDGEVYALANNEIFVSFGRNVNLNVFNQNRVGLGLGYRVAENFRLELEYLNQIVQHAALDRATQLPVFEFNNGVRASVVYNLKILSGEKRPAEAGEVAE